jgi:DNA-directed RNA polymerase sigma subunit (sigma70/sigma32)
MKPNKKQLNASLSEFHAKRDPDKRYTFQEIAEACGTSHQNIRYIQQKALQHCFELMKDI